jgi:hypothetical protein
MSFQVQSELEYNFSYKGIQYTAEVTIKLANDLDGYDLAVSKSGNLLGLEKKNFEKWPKMICDKLIQEGIQKINYENLLAELKNKLM